MVAHTSTLTAEDTDAMGLVDHDRAVVLMLQFYDFGQFTEVALHREDTVDDDEFDGFLWQFLEHTLKVLHVVVLVVELLGKGKSASVDNRCVVAIVADDVVVLTEQSGNNALVDAETSGEAQAVVFANKFGYFFLKLDMQIERTIEEAATCTTSAVFVECSLGSIDDALVASQTRVGIRPKHEHLMASHFHFRSLFSFDGAEIRIHICCHVFLRLTILLVSFL